jgi:hypothetical protein
MQYDHLVDEKRLDAFVQLIQTIEANLPEGFEKVEEYGGVSYVVPHATFPPGYHVTPEKPLPFISVIAQKRHIGLYHMGIYADPKLLAWFEDAYTKQVPTKLNMGKSCIRFTNVKNIPYDLIGELMQKVTPTQWIELYTQSINN